MGQICPTCQGTGYCYRQRFNPDAPNNTDYQQVPCPNSQCEGGRIPGGSR